MIIHLVTDEKFIDMASREFDFAAPGVNRYIILGRPRALRLVRRTRIEFMSLGRFRRLLRSGQVRAICLHNLFSGDFILRDVPDGIKVLWIGWGFDYYGRSYLRMDDSTGAESAASAAFVEWTRSVAVGSVRVLRRLRAGLPLRRPQPSRECLRRIDFFSPVLESEFRILSELNPWFDAEYVRWNYGTIEDDLWLDRPGCGRLGTGILLGNSATPSNNHLDALRLLAKSGEARGRKIYCPLSYGDARYGREVAKRGHEYFGAFFIPLFEFQERSAYFAMLTECGFVVMNHARQQALGSVVALLCMGAKVFLNRRSPVYAWLRGLGIEVFDVASLDWKEGHDDSSFEPLSEEKVAANRELLVGELGRDVQRLRTKALIDLLFQ